MNLSTSDMQMHQADSKMDAAARRKAEMDAKMAARHKEVGSMENVLHSLSHLWRSIGGRKCSAAGGCHSKAEEKRAQGASESFPSITAVDVVKCF